MIALIAKGIALIAEGIAMGSEEVALGAKGIAIGAGGYAMNGSRRDRHRSKWVGHGFRRGRFENYQQKVTPMEQNGSKCENEAIATGTKENVMRAIVIGLIAKGIALIAEGIAMGSEEVALRWE